MCQDVLNSHPLVLTEHEIKQVTCEGNIFLQDHLLVSCIMSIVILEKLCFVSILNDLRVRDSLSLIFCKTPDIDWTLDMQ